MEYATVFFDSVKCIGIVGKGEYYASKGTCPDFGVVDTIEDAINILDSKVCGMFLASLAIIPELQKLYTVMGY